MSAPTQDLPAVEMDWRPVWWSLVWSWVLMWIPTVLVGMKVASTSISLGDNSVQVRSGMVTKRTSHIDLYRVRDVSSSESTMAGGRVTLNMQDGTVHQLGPIRRPDAIAAALKRTVASERDRTNVQIRDDLQR